jgi:pantetheine-phosphate adenylyltransferase
VEGEKCITKRKNENEIYIKKTVCIGVGVNMAKRFVRAVFPGSFDPITNGHLDVIRRSIKLFDELIVAVGNSPVKEPLFTLQERVEMIKPLVADIPAVSVQSYDCLTVEYAASAGATVILRGLRNLTDVQYEFQLAMTNRAVAGIETVFVMTGEQYGFTSSALIREIAALGGNVSNLIPQSVYEKLQKRLAEKGAG